MSTESSTQRPFQSVAGIPEAVPLTCGCGVAPDGAPGTSQGCSAGCMVPEPDGVQQRPWAAVARFPEPFDPKLAVAHFAAMAYAHHLAYGAGIVTAPDGETVVDLTYRHFFPMTAALTAAASMDETRDWTSSLVRDAIADGSGVPETCWQWLTAAGIDPDEIAPAP